MNSIREEIKNFNEWNAYLRRQIFIEKFNNYNVLDLDFNDILLSKKGNRNDYEPFRLKLAKYLTRTNCKLDDIVMIDENYIKRCMTESKNKMLIIVDVNLECKGFALYEKKNYNQLFNTIKITNDQIPSKMIQNVNSTVIDDVIKINVLCSNNKCGSKLISLLEEKCTAMHCQAIILQSIPSSYDFYIKKNFLRTCDGNRIYPTYLLSDGTYIYTSKIDPGNNKIYAFNVDYDDGFLFMKLIKRVALNINGNFTQ